ncbi:MAG TPA: dipeptide epimerase, partial [Pedobacter sp.]
MNISWKPFELILKYPFRISGFSRTFTPVILLEIEHGGLIGRGEASMVPYMGESFQTAAEFLAHVKLTWIKHPFDYDEIVSYLDSIAPGKPAIKAA